MVTPRRRQELALGAMAVGLRRPSPPSSSVSFAAGVAVGAEPVVGGTSSSTQRRAGDRRRLDGRRGRGRGRRGGGGGEVADGAVVDGGSSSAGLGRRRRPASSWVGGTPAPSSTGATPGLVGRPVHSPTRRPRSSSTGVASSTSSAASSSIVTTIGSSFATSTVSVGPGWTLASSKALGVGICGQRDDRHVTGRVGADDRRRRRPRRTTRRTSIGLAIGCRRPEASAVVTPQPSPTGVTSGRAGDCWPAVVGAPSAAPRRSSWRRPREPDRRGVMRQHQHADEQQPERRRRDDEHAAAPSSSARARAVRARTDAATCARVAAGVRRPRARG